MNQKDLWKFNLVLFNIGGFVKRIQFGLMKRQTFFSIRKNTDLIADENQRKHAYVLALGPSLKQVDLNRIKGDTIVVNRFNKIGESFPDFVPTYYIVIDMGFTKNEDFKEALDRYANRGTIFILNSKLANSPLVNKIPEKQRYFISPFDGRIKVNHVYRIDEWQPAFQNVVGSAIFTLMLMGYKNITLLGCDFNSFASTTQNHCYKDKSDARLYPMWEELFAYSFAAKDHTDLQVIAERKGVSIINSTKGSLIDAYPKEIEEELYFHE